MKQDVLRMRPEAAFELVDIGPELIVVINDQGLAAAVRALNYAWQEGPETPERRAGLIRAVEDMFVFAANTHPAAARPAA